MKKTKEKFYQNRILKYRRFNDKAKKNSLFISYIRGVSFTICLIIFFAGPKSIHYNLLSLFFLTIFVIGVILHIKVVDIIKKVNTLVDINKEGIARLHDKWINFNFTGEEFLNDSMPHLLDLNIFGKTSLFQMIQHTSTYNGSRCLSNWLTRCDDFTLIPQRQEAIKNLSSMIFFRQHLLMEGKLLGKAPNPNFFLEWIKSPFYLFNKKWLIVLQRITVSITLALIFLQIYFNVKPFWIVSLIIQSIIFALTVGKCRAHYMPALNRDSLFLTYGKMFYLLEKQKFKADYLKNIQRKIMVKDTTLSYQMKKLQKINSSLSLCYSNPLFYLTMNILFLWDIHYLFQLERWKDKMSLTIMRCFDLLGEIEALSSLAGFSYDNPDYVYPIVDHKKIPLSTKGLGHPLLPYNQRVNNDFDILYEGFLGLITGSNMSGKSTFIRTLGINMVLAFAGAPVAAHKFITRPCRLFTCIQVKDSLLEHTSHFYAEVKGIKRIIEAVFHQQGKENTIPVLYLIDEIFAGTNTKERLIASRSIILKLASSLSYGLLTTHDLDLVVLSKESSKIKNYHFQDNVDDNGKMTFDYKIKEGPVHSTNALKILEIEGILCRVSGRP